MEGADDDDDEGRDPVIGSNDNVPGAAASRGPSAQDRQGGELTAGHVSNALSSSTPLVCPTLSLRGVRCSPRLSCYQALCRQAVPAGGSTPGTRTTSCSRGSCSSWLWRAKGCGRGRTEG
eukprot:994813-Rhodomonas_salina.1